MKPNPKINKNQIKNRELAELFGFIATIISITATIPQIYKTYVIRSASDISYTFLFLNIIGLGCMTTYGVSLSEKPLYIPTTISLFMTNVLLLEKIYFDFVFESSVEIV